MASSPSLAARNSRRTPGARGRFPQDSDIEPGDGGIRRRLFLGRRGRVQARQGVSGATSGYSGGGGDGEVSARRQRHDGPRQSVEVKYDPSKVTYGQLLLVFFSVAHDPTQLNRRAGLGLAIPLGDILYVAGQERVAKAYIAQLM
jgi:peptide-methionine (S)-S-oxide reductase